jgi:hypothetical protein
MFIALQIEMNPEWEWLTRSVYDASIFWAMITAVATFVLVFVAYFQLKSLARTSRSDFLYRLKKDFFTHEVRRLLFLVERDYLEFQEEEIAHFKIIGRDQPRVAERMRELGIEGDSVSTYRMEDELLGPLEDVGFLEKIGMVDFREVYETIETYYLKCMRHSRRTISSALTARCYSTILGGLGPSSKTTMCMTIF